MANCNFIKRVTMFLKITILKSYFCLNCLQFERPNNKRYQSKSLFLEAHWAKHFVVCKVIQWINKYKVKYYNRHK